MSITNINTLQKLAARRDSRQLSSYTDEYYKQSLSNLGQRFSIKGDGVTNGGFALYEIFNGTIPTPEEGDFDEYGRLYDSYMMACVSGPEGDRDITITAYSLINPDTGEHYDSEPLTLSAKDYVKLQEDLYVPGSKVQAYNGSPITYYGSTSIVTSSDSHFKTALRDMSGDGEARHTNDLSFNDYTDDTLFSGLRIYCTQDGLGLTLISYENTEGSGSQTTTKYKVSQYVIEPYNEVLDGLWDDLTNDTSYINSNPSSWDPLSVYEEIYKSYRNVIEEKGVCYAHTDIDSGEIILDNDTLDGNLGPGTVYGNIVEGNILQWNEARAKELPLFIEYYNEQVYFGINDNLSVKKRLVAKLLEALYDDFLNESMQTLPDDTVFPVYLPYEYQFIYTCNSANPSQIYSGTRDITVEASKKPEDDIWKISRTGHHGTREQMLICESSDISDESEDIYSLWRFFITYTHDNIVDNIFAFKAYTLPYVNDDGYWNVNGVDTSIYARGKDGGQPSVIISYSDTLTGQKEILSTMFKSELSYALDWETTYFQVRPLDTSATIGSSAYHMMSTYMPTNISSSYIAENLVTFLENAIIMDISSVHSEILDMSTEQVPLADPSELGEDATITTFWALSKDPQTDEYYFSYVKQPQTSWAIDFNYLTDAESIIKYYMQLGIQPDVYRHRWLVFTGISSILKNQEDQISYTTVFPTIINRLASDVSDMFSPQDSVDNKYYNNLNFVPAFQSEVEFSGSYITSVPPENKNKFFHFDTYSYDGVSYHYVPVAQKLRSSKTLALDYYPNTRLQSSSSQSEHTWLDSLLPILDLKEVFVRDANLLNRCNILTTGKDGRMYYSYIGGTPDSNIKKVIHFGTSYQNIDIGLKTMTEESERSYFEIQPELSIDFPTVTIHGDVILKRSWQEYQA